MSARLARTALLVSIAGLGAAACTPVPAWRRSHLAHPTMAPGSPVGVAEGHLHDVQEGAIGGSDGEGAGCGCN